MKYTSTGVLIFVPACINIQAQEKRDGPEAIEVRIETGTKDGKLEFVPDKLRFPGRRLSQSRRPDGS